MTAAEVLAEWKGQYKVEHRFRRLNQVFLGAPWFLKTPRRIAALVFLIMVGALVAGLIERQVRRVLAQRQQPIQGLMPEGRDTLRPTVERLFKAFADYSLVVVKNDQGQTVLTRFAQFSPVQDQIRRALGFPQPEEMPYFFLGGQKVIKPRSHILPVSYSDPKLSGHSTSFSVECMILQVLRDVRFIGISGLCDDPCFIGRHLAKSSEKPFSSLQASE